MASIVPRLLDIARDEWRFFGSGEIRLDGTTVDGRKEYQDGAWQRVGGYWRCVGGSHAHLTGKDRGHAWSAAFVSFCLQAAGAGERFPPAAGHATYINAAIRNAVAGHLDAPTLGRRPEEHVLKPGDLIGAWRGPTPVRFDTARRIGWYQSHCDIVVAVEDGIARAIGGNVANSVMCRQVALNAEGHLADRTQNWFVVIDNAM